MIKIAVSTEYRLPGVYSNEIEGMRINTTTGGNAVVAFVGPSIGSSKATQLVSLEGVETVRLNNAGVVGTPTVTGKINRTTYVPDTDYVLTNIEGGYVDIRRNVEQTDTEYSVVSNQHFTYFSAQPIVDILVDNDGKKIDGHIIKGTVTIQGEDGGSGPIVYNEGEDYVIDYYQNTFATIVGGALEDENDIELIASYHWTAAEPVELFGESTFTLKHKYVAKDGLTDANSGYVHTLQIVSCKTADTEYGEHPGVYDAYEKTGYIGYIEGIDYVVDYDTGRISRTADSRIPEFTQDAQNYMYVAYGYCAIKDDEQLIVSYRYVDSAYNEAKWFNDYNEFSDTYGIPWDNSGELQSPISMAAYIAARNGMSGCYGVSVAGTTEQTSSVTYSLDAWVQAFDALTVVDGIDIVVPLSGDREVWQVCAEHLSRMYDNQDERIAILGVDGVDAPYTTEQMIEAASSLNSEDMWLVSPSSFNFRNPITGIVEAVPGYYAAAAIAGYNSSVPQYTPLTSKVVSGFFSAKEYLKKQDKTNQAGNGLMYIDEVGGALRVLHGVTTDASAVLHRESNIVLTKYFIIKTLRRTFANGYIGSIITDRTLLGIQSTVENVLRSLRDGDYLSDFEGVYVSQNDVDPTQVDIQFAYIPMYGLNYIEIEFSVMTGTE